MVSNSDLQKWQNATNGISVAGQIIKIDDGKTATITSSQRTQAGGF
jgi:hypothetical protein